MKTRKNSSDAGLVRFVVLGDVEPKPDPIFPNLEKAVEAINTLNDELPIDFVASVGDIARNGTLDQYDAATKLLIKLGVPLFGIMGNEELVGGEERFLEYITKWNGNLAGAPQVRFVKTIGQYAYIFASASEGGIRFNAEEIQWLNEQMKANSNRTIALFTHAPAQDVFAGAQSRRCIPNEQFEEILRSPGLHLHFSGHIHMDLDSVVTHVMDENAVHHVHAPGIERTKVGDFHTPRLRVVTMKPDGSVDIESYNLDTKSFEEQHRIQFGTQEAVI